MKKIDVGVYVFKGDFVGITSYNDKEQTGETLSRVRSIRHQGNNSSVTLEFPPNDRHSSPPDLVLKATHKKDMPFVRLPRFIQGNHTLDVIRRLDESLLTDQEKNRFHR